MAGRVAIEVRGGGFVVARDSGRRNDWGVVYETEDYDPEVVGNRRMGVTSGADWYLSQHARSIGLMVYARPEHALRVNPLR